MKNVSRENDYFYRNYVVSIRNQFAIFEATREMAARDDFRMWSFFFYFPILFLCCSVRFHFCFNDPRLCLLLPTYNNKKNSKIKFNQTFLSTTATAVATTTAMAHIVLAFWSYDTAVYTLCACHVFVYEDMLEYRSASFLLFLFLYSKYI